MDGIRQYLLSIVTAGIISAVLVKIAGEKGLLSSTIKLLAGLFMSITVISPLIKLQITEFSNYLYNIEVDMKEIIEDGALAANTEKSAIIIQETETYILDKAASLSANIEVQVTLSDSDIPYPFSVTLSGDVSPFGRQQLQNIIANDLGIPEERQLWR